MQLTTQHYLHDRQPWSMLHVNDFQQSLPWIKQVHL